MKIIKYEDTAVECYKKAENCKVRAMEFFTLQLATRVLRRNAECTEQLSTDKHTRH